MHMAAPVAPGLAFTLGVEQQVQGDIRLCQLIPQVVEHRKAVMVLQPAVGCGDQQINVGVGPGLAAGPGAEQAHFTPRNHLVNHSCHGWQPLLNRWSTQRSHGAILLGAIASARKPSIQRWCRLVVSRPAREVWSTPLPWHAPPRLCGEPIAGADRKGEPQGLWP